MKKSSSRSKASLASLKGWDTRRANQVSERQRKAARKAWKTIRLKND